MWKTLKYEGKYKNEFENFELVDEMVREMFNMEKQMFGM